MCVQLDTAGHRKRLNIKLSNTWQNSIYTASPISPNNTVHITSDFMWVVGTEMILQVHL